jgi:hypothetical protein
MGVTHGRRIPDKRRRAPFCKLGRQLPSVFSSM